HRRAQVLEAPHHPALDQLAVELVVDQVLLGGRVEHRDHLQAGALERPVEPALAVAQQLELVLEGGRQAARDPLGQLAVEAVLEAEVDHHPVAVDLDVEPADPRIGRRGPRRREREEQEDGRGSHRRVQITSRGMLVTMGKQTTEKRAAKVLAKNRKARHDYHILETFTAGMALKGTEVKSVRAGKIQLKDSYVEVRDGQAWLVGAHISPYSHGNRENHDPERPRKLLLHRRE